MISWCSTVTFYLCLQWSLGQLLTLFQLCLLVSCQLNAFREGTCDFPCGKLGSRMSLPHLAPVLAQCLSCASRVWHRRSPHPDGGNAADWRYAWRGTGWPWAGCQWASCAGSTNLLLYIHGLRQVWPHLLLTQDNLWLQHISNGLLLFCVGLRNVEIWKWQRDVCFYFLLLSHLRTMQAAAEQQHFHGFLVTS